MVELKRYKYATKVTCVCELKSSLPMDSVVVVR